MTRQGKVEGHEKATTYKQSYQELCNSTKNKMQKEIDINLILPRCQLQRELGRIRSVPRET